MEHFNSYKLSRRTSCSPILTLIKNKKFFSSLLDVAQARQFNLFSFKQGNRKREIMQTNTKHLNVWWIWGVIVARWSQRVARFAICWHLVSSLLFDSWTAGLITTCSLDVRWCRYCLGTEFTDVFWIFCRKGSIWDHRATITPQIHQTQVIPPHFVQPNSHSY